MVLPYALCLQLNSNGIKINYEVSNRHVINITQKTVYLHESDN